MIPNVFRNYALLIFRFRCHFTLENMTVETYFHVNFKLKSFDPDSFFSKDYLYANKMLHYQVYPLRLIHFLTNCPQVLFQSSNLHYIENLL